MKSADHKTALLLDKCVELLFQIYLLRGDCCQAARSMNSMEYMDEASLEDCACLDDTLAKSFTALRATVRHVQRARAKRRRRRVV